MHSVSVKPATSPAPVPDKAIFLFNYNELSKKSKICEKPRESASEPALRQFDALTHKDIHRTRGHVR